MRAFLVSAALVLLVLFGLLVNHTATSSATPAIPQTPAAVAATHSLPSRVSSPVVRSLYRVVGSPTLNGAFIERVLHIAHSPAAGTGQALYDLGVQYHLDPAVALAFFEEESHFGTLGEARLSRSLGNLRCLPQVTCQDGYAWFASWQAGYRAWYVLIATVYVAQWHLSTVDQIIPVYAPSSENDVAAYIAAVKTHLDRWHQEEVQP